MIIDIIKNRNLYTGISVNLKNALEFISQKEFLNIAVGKHEIDSNMFLLVNEYTTKTIKTDILEAHKQYIDLQYIIKGEEIIEYEPLGNHLISKTYDKDNDYILYKSQTTNRLKMTEGMFAIFFPEDLHMPGVIVTEQSNVKKIVLKVLIKK